MKQFCSTFIAITTLAVTQALLKPPEDAKLNFTALGYKYGHTVEEYDVVTEDGYIITIFRIPGKKKGPILLVHGIANAAESFIIRGKKSLAITLADDGYDVWAGNSRGNKYGRRHRYLNPDKDTDFWNFTFHEVGYYDLAATIDFILIATGEKTLRSIGHSQGTTVNFVLMSTRPEYNEKIEVFIALAPIAYLNNLKPPVSTVVELGPVINVALESLGVEELFRDHASTTELLRKLCSQGIVGYKLCFLWLFLPFVGVDPKRVEPEFFAVTMDYTPAGTNRKSLLHYDQVALNKRFAQFDHGSLKNVKKYGLLVPPSYDMRRVTAKVSLFVGRNDLLSTLKDVDILRNTLPNVVDYYVMKPELWNHVDYIWANDMDVYLYPHLFSVLKKFECN